MTGYDPDWHPGRKTNVAPQVSVEGLARSQRDAARAGSLLGGANDEAPSSHASTDPEPWARPTRRRKAPGERWEDRHIRRTFHLPTPISEAIDAEVRADEDLSLAAAATEAFEAWLRLRQRAAARKEKA